MKFDDVHLAYYAGLVVALIGGILLYRRRPSSLPLEDRLVGAVLPFGLLALALTMAASFCEAPRVVWNGPRLSASFALVHGYNLYYTAGNGPVLQWIYGPVAPLLFLPATLADSPSNAVSIAELLVQLFYYGPVLGLFLLGQRGGARSVILAGAALVCFAFFTLRSPPLILASNWVHADAPALGLGMLAAVVLFAAKSPAGHGALAASALLAVLAAWTKQSLLAVGVGLALYLWLARGWAALLRYVLYLTASAVVVSGIFLWVFGFEAMWFNMVAILSHGVARPRGMVVELNAALQELLLAALPLIAMVVVCCCWQRRSTLGASDAKPQATWAVFLGENRWVMLVIVGLVNIPLSIRHRANFGGADNALAPCLYYLLAGAILGLMTMAEEKRTVKMLAAVFLAAFAYTMMPQADALEHAVARRQDNMSENMFRQLKQRPGSVYLVDNPLPALMAEGKLYHFSSGIFGRDFAQQPLTQEEFWNHVPANVEMIVFAPDTTIIDEGYAHPALRFISEFSERTLLRDESAFGWVVYRRKSNRDQKLSNFP